MMSGINTETGRQAAAQDLSFNGAKKVCVLRSTQIKLSSEPVGHTG